MLMLLALLDLLENNEGLTQEEKNYRRPAVLKLWEENHKKIEKIEKKLAASDKPNAMLQIKRYYLYRGFMLNCMKCAPGVEINIDIAPVPRFIALVKKKMEERDDTPSKSPKFKELLARLQDDADKKQNNEDI